MEFSCTLRRMKGPTAEQIRSYFMTLESPNRANAHFIVDDTEVLEIVPVTNVAWGAGYTANGKFLQIEMCEFDDPDRFHRVYLTTIELINVLAKSYGWILKDHDTLWSHNETSLEWHETTHVDPVPYLEKHGHTWEGFVQDAIEGRRT